jgi:hypothetical protein
MCVNAVLHSNTIVTKRKIESIVPWLSRNKNLHCAIASCVLCTVCIGVNIMYALQNGMYSIELY